MIKHGWRDGERRTDAQEEEIQTGKRKEKERRSLINLRGKNCEQNCVSFS